MDKNEYLSAPEILSKLMLVDYPLIVRIILPIIILNISSRIASNSIRKYKIHKDFKPTDISKITIPAELEQKYSEVDMERFAATSYKEIIMEFTKKLEANFSDHDLTNFYNNINELTVKEKDFVIRELLTNHGAVALYKPKENNISIHNNMPEEYAKPVLYHELFHMASSVYVDKVRYSGFAQKTVKSGIRMDGVGLNEGYTELLTQRFCDEKITIADNYKESVKIAKYLEEIVDSELMQEFYFKADLSGLIDELKKYAPEEEIAKFISSSDFIHNYLCKQPELENQDEMIRQSFKNVYGFLLRAYINKEELNYNEGLISEETFIHKIAKKATLYDDFQTIGRKRYIYLKNEEIKEIVSSSLGDDLEKKIEERRHIY